MSPIVLRLLLVVGGILAVAALAWWWQRRDGRIRQVDDDGARLSPDHLDALGLRLDGEATAGAVLLGSPACAPCTTVKRILGEVADDRPGFRWVYADAADHLPFVEQHRVLRVPTLFVVDRGGRILARTSGVPAGHELTAVIDRGGDARVVA